MSSSSARGNLTSCSKVSGISWRQLGNCPSIKRDARVTGPARKTAWFLLRAISTESAPSVATMRASSRSAFAGTLASTSRVASSSSSDCFTLRR